MCDSLLMTPSWCRNMTRLRTICTGLCLLAATALWAQVNAIPQTREEDSEPLVVGHPEDRMQAPPPVTGMSFDRAFTSEEQGNYLRYGMSFTTAHTDNALGGLSGNQASDFSYSLAPTIAIDETTSRMHWVANYAPGFTFYQHTSSRNEADHHASIDVAYRFSPRLSISARDGFEKSSSVFNQANLGAAGGVSGGVQVPNLSVIAPVASRLSNAATLDLTYQFALNQMVGAAESFTNLHYPDPTQVPGLFDSASQVGSGFYSLRLSSRNYLGGIYQYQRLLSYPTAGLSETQTNSAMLFYTVYPNPHFSISMFGGPQYANTMQPAGSSSVVHTAITREWTPAAGGSLAWQGQFQNLAFSYSHLIAGGGGLMSAVHMDSAAFSFRRQLVKTLSASINGLYTQNKIIDDLSEMGFDGHTLSGTAAVQKRIGEHLGLELGYTRLHQSYGSIPVLAKNPDTNREFISISYQFARPLGR
jgi:hypothetical protein